MSNIHRLNPPEPSRIGRQAAARQDRGPPPAGTIEVTPGFFNEAVDSALHLLETSAITEGIYRQGARLVRLTRATEDAPPQTLELDSACLRYHLSKIGEFSKFNARLSEYVATDPPAPLVEAVLSLAGNSRIAELRGVAEAPLALPCGRFLNCQGFDERTGIYLASDLAGMELPGTIHKRAAEDAAGVIADIVATWKASWQEPLEDESAAVAALMTAVLRPGMPTAPLIGITATAAGSGKGLLASTIAAIANGRRTPEPPLTLARDAGEAEKRMVAKVLSGANILLIDNLSGPLRSDLLCTLLTSPRATLRPLGSGLAATVTPPLFVANGNALTLIGDLTRRAMRIRIDPRTEKPHEREFERDAIHYALERRRDAVQAINTLCLAYQYAGCPPVGSRPFGSFEVWDRMIRRPLMWVGYPDPLAGAAGLNGDDHEAVATGDMLRILAEWQTSPAGAEPWTAADIVRASRMDGQSRVEGLADTLDLILGQSAGDPRSLGYLLRSITGRYFDGRTVRRTAKQKHGVAWRIEVYA